MRLKLVITGYYAAHLANVVVEHGMILFNEICLPYWCIWPNIALSFRLQLATRGWPMLALLLQIP